MDEKELQQEQNSIEKIKIEFDEAVSYRNDAEKEFVKSVIDSLNDKIDEWESGLNFTGSQHPPVNAITQRPYNNINMWMLYVKQLGRFASNEWLTFNQAKERNIRINKGEKGTKVLFYRLYDKKEKKDWDVESFKKLSLSEQERKRKEDLQVITTSFTVFNRSQCTGDFPTVKTLTPAQADNQLVNQYVKNIVQAFGIEIEHKQATQAHYNLTQDKVVLPEITDYIDDKSYYSVLIHELTHASGHDSRMNRNMSENYAKEEVITETAAATQCLQLGLDVKKNSSIYVKSWIKALRFNQKIFLEAIKEAGKTASYMEEKGKLKELLSQRENVAMLPHSELSQVITEREFENVLKMVEDQVITYTLETSGTSYTNDAVLKLTILSAEKEVLFEKTFLPDNPEILANELPHGLTVDDFKGATYFEESKELIQSIFNRAKRIVSFNPTYSNKFLEKNGIKLDNNKLYDVMKEYALVHGEWDGKFKKYKWASLSKVIEYYTGIKNYDAREADGVENAQKILECYAQLEPEARVLKEIKSMLSNYTMLKRENIQTGRVNDCVIFKDKQNIIAFNLEQLQLLKKHKFYKTTNTETIQFENLNALREFLKTHSEEKIKSTEFDQLINNDIKATYSSDKPIDYKQELNYLKQVVLIEHYAQEKLHLTVKNLNKFLTFVEHDSVRIYENNTFCRFSKDGVGGSILDFIIEFDPDIQGETKSEQQKSAILLLKSFYQEHIDEIKSDINISYSPRIQRKEFMLPEKDENNQRVIDYLSKNRKISHSVIQEWIDHGAVYQGVVKLKDGREIPNCAFVGAVGTLEDGSKVYKYAQVHGLSSKSYKQEVPGSIKEVGVWINNHAQKTVVTESVIDAMSYQMLHPNEKFNFLSVNGVKAAESVLMFHYKWRKKPIEESQYIIALDNDGPGIDAANRLMEFIEQNTDRSSVIEFPEVGKDFNEQLVLETEQREKELAQNKSKEKKKEKTAQR